MYKRRIDIFKLVENEKKQRYFLELYFSLHALTHILITYHSTGHLLIISVFPISMDLVFQGEIKREV